MRTIYKLHRTLIVSLRGFALLLVFVLQFDAPAYAQWENIWAFGQYGGLDFSTTPPSPYLTAIDGYGEAFASVCNASGELLFYTDGSRVWDHSNNLMPNGSSLNPLYNFYLNPLITGSTSQGTIIIPVPNAPNLYYIMSLTDRESGINYGRLYSSLVDMTLNDGNGDVVTGQNGILIDTGLTERMTAVTGNDCNIWLLSLSQNDELKAYEITGADTIASPITTPLDNTVLGIDETGKIAVSPNRQYIAITYGNQGVPRKLKLCTFDPSSGTVTSIMLLGDSTYTYGACFSPDNTKLYVGDAGVLCQYNLSAGNAAAISASKTPLDTVVGVFDIKRGPDQKLYYTMLSYIGVIHQPNTAGLGCNSEPDYISLPYPMLGSIGLPNVVPVITGYTDTITVNYSDTLCFASGQLHVPDSAINVLWSNGSTEQALAVYSSGQYWVRYNLPSSQQCTLHSDTFNITYIAPIAQQLTITASCYNDSDGAAKIVPVNNTYNYIWRSQDGTVLSEIDTLGGISSGNYILEVITPEGCNSYTNFVIPEERYRISFSVDSIVCKDEAVIFQNTSDNYYTNFKWFFGSGDNSTLENPTYNYNVPGTYQIMLIANGDKCSDTAMETVIVDAPGDNYSFVMDRNAICTGESVAFTVNSADVDSTFTGTTWDFGDSSYLQSAESIMNLKHAYDTVGDLAVTLLSHFRACPDSAYVDTVHVFPLPIVNLGDDTSVCANGAPIALQNRYNNVNVRSMAWNTGATTPRLKVTEPGIYSLTVKTEPIGCSNTDEVEVKKDCYIDIPNVFTPNNDGVNDYFFPRQLLTKSLTQFKMQILNRWGQVIFETTNINGRGWDGKFNNVEQPAGVYVYQIDATISNEDVQHYQGNVTLIR